MTDRTPPTGILLTITVIAALIFAAMAGYSIATVFF